jgi:hypothetical protein
MTGPVEPAPGRAPAEPGATGRTHTGAARPSATRPDHPTPPDPHPPLTSANTIGRNDRFDMLDDALATYDQGRQRPLAVTLEIVWVDGPAADALRRSQARVLRDLLVALTSGPARAIPEDEQEAP